MQTTDISTPMFVSHPKPWKRYVNRFVAAVIMWGAAIVGLCSSAVLAADTTAAGQVTLNFPVLAAMVSLVGVGGTFVYGYAILGGTVRNHDARLRCLDNEDGLTVRMARVELRLTALERQGERRQELLERQTNELHNLSMAISTLTARMSEQEES